MLDSLLLSLLFLLVPAHLARTFLPGTYAAATRVLRQAGHALCRLIRYTLFGPRSQDRQRQRGVERFVPKRSKRR